MAAGKVSILRGTAPAAPATGRDGLYFDANGILHHLDDNSVDWPIYSGGYATTATAAGTTTLTEESAQSQFFTGTTTQTITLPVTSTLALGFFFRIVNRSTAALTINSSGGNLVLTLQAGGVAYITCILLTGTTAASWDAQTVAKTDAAQTFTGVLTAADTTDATSSTAAGTIVSGGLAVNKKLFVGTLLDLSTATAGQIKFPAAANLSADANTLDDYEEGSWTPGFSFGGTAATSYVDQVGSYQKIGNRVFFQGHVQINVIGAGTGTARITGLPFTPKNTTNLYSGCSIGITGSWVTAPTTNMMVVSIDPNLTTMLLYYLTGGSLSPLTHANFSAGLTYIAVSGHYETAA